MQVWCVLTQKVQVDARQWLACSVFLVHRCYVFQKIRVLWWHLAVFPDLFIIAIVQDSDGSSVVCINPECLSQPPFKWSENLYLVLAMKQLSHWGCFLKIEVFHCQPSLFSLPSVWVEVLTGAGLISSHYLILTYDFPLTDGFWRWPTTASDLRQITVLLGTGELLLSCCLWTVQRRKHDKESLMTPIRYLAG